MAQAQVGHAVTVRRDARVLAMQVLYEQGQAGRDAVLALEQRVDDERVEAGTARFARELIGGIAEHSDQIDTTITRLAPQWPLSGVAAVDLAVLRVALEELMHDHGTPPKVAINEAIDIAKNFGGENSGRFVNGVLGRFASQLAT